MNYRADPDLFAAWLLITLAAVAGVVVALIALALVVL